METLTQTSLEIGRECWMEHEKGIFQGEQDGLFVIRIEDRKELTDKHISYRPIVDDGWRPTGVYKNKNEYLQFNGKLYCWMRDHNLTFLYGMKTNGTFGDGKILDRAAIEKLEGVSDGMFLGAEAINDLIYEVDKKIAPLRNQANDLNAQINKLEKEKDPIYAKCFHDWDKHEEEQWGSNGTSYRQMCVCENCGKEQYSYFSKF